jgi:lipopolysaccharide transport system permease protein
MAETRIRVIKPKIGILDLGFSEIWAYRELLYFLVWKEIKIRYKQTVIGAAWAVLQPLLTAIIFAFLLGGTLIKGVPTDGVPYFAFAFTGLILWTYFSNSVSGSANSLIVNANLVAKVYFPRALIPLTSCITGLLDYGIATVLLFIILILFGVSLTPMLILLLLPIALMSILASGLALWLSAIDVKYRDVAYIVPFFIQLLFFATPILYATSLIPKSYEWVVYLNPLSGLFLLQRGIFLGTSIDWILVGISTLLAIIIFFTGMAYFRHYEKDIADVI